LGFPRAVSPAHLVKAGKLRNNGLIQSHRFRNDDEGEIMSSNLYFPRLARMVLLGAAGLVSAGFGFWIPSAAMARSLASTEAATQDPYGGGQDDGPMIQLPTDDGTYLPARRRAKAARKKGSASEKTKKADSTAKDKSATKKASGADKSGKLLFSQEIAPILVANCTGCHSGDGNGLKRGKLDLSTFAKMQAGTPNHKVIEPGKPAESELVLRIKGESEPKMPQGNNAALSAAAIAKIERWVKEGATIDSGNDPKKLISSYAAGAEQVRRAEVAKLPVGERDKTTEEVGTKRYQQANASLKPEIERSAHYMMFSNLPKDRAANTLKGLEAEYGQLKRILGTAGTDWPEKVSIYAFSSRKDFIEFIRTVEGRQDVDGEEATSARLSVPQPYVAVFDPQGGKKDEPGGAPKRKGRGRRGEEKAGEGSAERSLQGLLTESLGSAVVISAGKAPRWLAFGIGSYLASQVESHSPYYRQLGQTAFANYQQGWPTRANEALGGSDQLTADGLRSIAFGMVEWMMTPDLKQGFPAFVGGMLAGTEKLDETLQRVYRVNREEFINYSGDWIAQRYGQAR
jgi:cytochrome c553